MKNLFQILFSVILFSSFANAACDKPVTYLEEGKPAPCTGYLFTPEKELEVRIKVSSYDKLEDAFKKQDLLTQVLNERVENSEKRIGLYQEKISNMESTNFYSNLLYFSIGVVTTYLITSVVITNVPR